MPNPVLHRPGLPQRTPVEFSVDGEDYELPELPARVWLDACVLTRPWSWLRLVPGEVTRVNDAPSLGARLVDVEDRFDLTDLELLAEKVLTAGCGMDFHAACRLAHSAWGNWLYFDGWCLSTTGIDPLALPFPRLLAATYAWRRSLCADKAEFARLEGELWRPPPPLTMPGRSRDPRPAGWSDEVEAASFFGTVAALGGSLPAAVPDG